MFKYRMSVIVPVYNCEDYLASCLDSLLRQTISKDELEVLLIDDGSKDGSLAYARNMPKNMIFSRCSRSKTAAFRQREISVSSTRRVSI